MPNQIDFLYEDPEIPSQKFSLISIVGPEMPQKCSVWGIKVRGACDSMESAKELSRKLNSIDPNYDIYTVETGKFVPLVVDPSKVKAEYANEELDKLMKGYMENKEQAKSAWEKNKNEQIAKAAAEGSSGGQKRTPELIINTIKTLKARLAELDSEKSSLLESLADYEDSFSKLTPEEQETVMPTTN